MDEIALPGTAVDVGANHGLYSYSLVRRGHPVVAFEPQPWCARTLRGWAGERVRVHEIGLSDCFDILPLQIPLDRNGRSSGLASLGTDEVEAEVIRVPVVPLDAFEMTDVSFMKIDVEGHEHRVLRGAERTIARCSPALLVEINAAKLNDDEIRERFDLIQKFGYNGFFLNEDAWHPLSQYSIERFQRLRLGGDESAPLVYNFVFRHRAK
ncbi:MAG: FkbM family methyltransferase [Actinomycetota bacterium]|nr:FkbM family methyltransferase [Actinomycetota bacterium]